ncbi:MAG: uracil-DNA glycosylase [Gracilimonas sp.]|uniref:uracil-DNA glycosylase n=1 Tax=Gracilimonas sp. TaxID=1974203 RepID=UPI003751FB09|nr:uracil-DNA glycosylase [Gracilimonas sp.]
MSDPKELIEKAERFIKQQQKMYGDFSLNLGEGSPAPKSLNQQRDENAEADQVKESSEDYDTPATQKSVQPEPKKELSTAEKIAACQTLDELQALCKESDELRTDLEGTNLVFGVGDPNADLMIVGEAPGFNEDKQGEPFVGEAGQLLDKIMKAINFKREDIYIANILKHRPPNNRDPKPEERQRSLPYLLRQIELIDPKLILCVGRISATTLLDKNTSLSKLRGEFHPFHGRELMATYHPAALLRNQQWKRPTWEDVQKLRKRYDELGGK